MIDRDENGNAVIRIPLIGPTAPRLESLAREIGICPVALAASLLHDILEDDESAHVSPDEIVPESLLKLN